MRCCTSALRAGESWSIQISNLLKYRMTTLKIMVTVLADSAMVRENGIGTGKRKFYYALSHNCSGNGKIVGAAVFAGLRKIEDEEE